MAYDFANDPRFVRVPEKFITELKTYPFTAGEGTDDAYQEVQFDIGGIMMQCAVLGHEWMPAADVDVDQIVKIIKVWHPNELS